MSRSPSLHSPAATTAAIVGLCLLALAGALAAGPAAAGTCAGVDLPDSVAVRGAAAADAAGEVGAALRLNGVGLRRVSFLGLPIEVYVAGLYLARPAADAESILSLWAGRRLELHFLRSTDAERIHDGLRDAFHHAGRTDAPSQQQLAELARHIPALEAGQSLVFSDLPAGGLAIEAVGVSRGEIEGEDVARAVFGHWLGPHAMDRRLEAGLLGGACD